jgi:hypothetical protein
MPRRPRAVGAPGEQSAEATRLTLLSLEFLDYILANLAFLLGETNDVLPVHEEPPC